MKSQTNVKPLLRNVTASITFERKEINFWQNGNGCQRTRWPMRWRLFEVCVRAVQMGGRALLPTWMENREESRYCKWKCYASRWKQAKRFKGWPRVPRQRGWLAWDTYIEMLGRQVQFGRYLNLESLCIGQFKLWMGHVGYTMKIIKVVAEDL